jgi:acetoacetyl-CoA synthetase
MYSSGTTGLPKCMVQSAGGVLLNQLKEQVLHVPTSAARIASSTSPPAAG